MPLLGAAIAVIVVPSSAPMRRCRSDISEARAGGSLGVAVACVVVRKEDSSDDHPPEDIVCIRLGAYKESITRARSASILALLPFVTPACFANASVRPACCRPIFFRLSCRRLKVCSVQLLGGEGRSYAVPAPHTATPRLPLCRHCPTWPAPAAVWRCPSGSPPAFRSRQQPCHLLYRKLPDISSAPACLMILPILLSPSVAVR